MAALNNVTTQDTYVKGATLLCPRAQRFVLHARNAAVYYQLGFGYPSVAWDIDERFLPPGTLVRTLTFDALRVRSAATGKSAQVTIDTLGGAT